MAAEEVEEIRRPTPEEQAQFDADVEELFEGLFEMEAQGKISMSGVQRFFPKDVVERAEKLAKE